MSKDQKIAVTLGGIFLLLAAFLIGGYLRAGRTELALGAGKYPVANTTVINYAGDVVGTHVGTSTIGVDFETTATSSYISRIGRAKTLANYMITAVSASATTNNLNFTVQGSNDYGCDTVAGSASSTTDVVQSNINWTSAGDHLVGSTGATALTNVSSTKMITVTNVSTSWGGEILLTNLNYECLKLGVSGASTTAYVSLMSK